MKSLLNFINKEMDDLNIPYEFGEWNKEHQFPFFVGEISENVNQDEDGKSEYDFTLTGTDKMTTINMLDINEKIKSKYNNGYKTMFNGGGIVIIYENMLFIPSVNENIKRIQINLKIKLWEI